jgi:hypothetical protein
VPEGAPAVPTDAECLAEIEKEKKDLHGVVDLTGRLDFDVDDSSESDPADAEIEAPAIAMPKGRGKGKGKGKGKGLGSPIAEVASTKRRRSSD